MRKSHNNTIHKQIEIFGSFCEKCVLRKWAAWMIAGCPK